MLKSTHFYEKIFSNKSVLLPGNVNLNVKVGRGYCKKVLRSVTEAVNMRIIKASLLINTLTAEGK